MKEVVRKRPLGLVPTALGGFGGLAAVACVAAGVEGSSGAWGAAVGGSCAALALGVALMRRPHRIVLEPEQVQVRGRLGLATFALRRSTLGARRDPGPSAGRLLLEVAALAVALAVLCAARGQATVGPAAVLALAGYAGAYARLRGPRVVLSGVDERGGTRCVRLDPQGWDDLPDLEAALRPPVRRHACLRLPAVRR